MKVPVRYVGARPTFEDHLYNSGATWEFGETVKVDPRAAERLLQHPEFEDARPPKDQDRYPVRMLAAQADLANPPELTEEEFERLQEAPLVNLDTMTKAQLSEFAQRNWGLRLDSGQKKADLINAVRMQMGRRPV